MAQTGFTAIQLYSSTTAAAAPSAGNLAAGELAINTTDEKLYFKNTAGAVKLLAANLTAIANGGTGQTTAAAAITALAGSQTSGYYLRSNGTNTLLAALAAADMTGILSITNGGTGQSTAAAAITALSGSQTSGYYLRSNGTNTALSALAAADITGTVAVANGGTGQTTYTNGQLLIGNTTGNTLSKATLTEGANISITNGAGTITIAATGIGAGTVTSVSVVSANGLAGTVATDTTTPAITLTTSITGVLKGNGTAISAAVAGTDYVTPTGTETLTNKRVTPRVSTTTSSATPTINTDNVDQYGLTAQAVNITSFTTNLSGTPTNGQKLWIYIVGTAARTISWGASFEASTVALPTTTVTTNRLDVGFVWNAVTSKWRCVAVA